MANQYKLLNISGGGGGGGSDSKVKVSADDTAADYLEGKIEAASSKVVVTTQAPGADETLLVDVDESAIDHNALLNYDVNQHRDLDDTSTTSSSLWSSTKIQAELDDKINAATPMTDNKLVKSVGTSGVDVEATGITVDDSNNITGVNDLTIDGDLTVNGTTTSVNSNTLDVTDANITVNNGGDQASANAGNAGLTIEMSDATDVEIGYDSTIASKMALGEIGSQSEIITANHIQTLTNKTIDADSNTLSNVETDNLKTGVLQTDISGGVSDTNLPSSQAVKTYVTDQLALQDDASEISYTPSTLADWDGGVDPGQTNDALDQLADRSTTTEGTLADHLNGGAAKHTSTSITNTAAGNLTSVVLQDSLVELQEDIDTRALASGLNDHIADTVDAHDASAISNVAAGNIIATDVQSALNELDTEKYIAADFNDDYDTRLATKDTDNLSEGATNLYYTDARANVVAGDIPNTSFTFANNASATNITGLAFNQASVLSFTAYVGIDRSRDGFYEEYEINGINKGSEFDISLESVGDDTGLEISITPSGQVQYTSSNLTSGGLLKFRAKVNLNAFTDPVGDLDTSFGISGIARLTGFQINHLKFQSDGKVVVGGDLTGDIKIARFNQNGTLDESFGTSGIATIDPSGNTDYIRDMVIDSSDRIIIASRFNVGGLSERPSISRLSVNGALDTSFNLTGTLNINPGFASRINSIGIQSDGKIMGIGEGYDGLFRLYATRVNDNGTIDTGYATSGTLLSTAFSGSLYSMALNDDDETYFSGASGGNVIIGKLTTAGVLDTLFNNVGYKTYSYLGNGGVAFKVQIKGSSLFSSGNTGVSGTGFVLKTDLVGAEDLTFGDAGWATVDFGTSSTFSEAAILDNDKILLVGATNLTTTGDFAIAKFGVDGLLDPEFSTDGKLTIDFDGKLDYAREVILLYDGKFIVGGNSTETDGTTPQVVLVKIK